MRKIVLVYVLIVLNEVELASDVALAEVAREEPQDAQLALRQRLAGRRARGAVQEALGPRDGVREDPRVRVVVEDRAGLRRQESSADERSPSARSAGASTALVSIAAHGIVCGTFAASARARSASARLLEPAAPATAQTSATAASAANGPSATSASSARDAPPGEPLGVRPARIEDARDGELPQREHGRYRRAPVGERGQLVEPHPWLVVADAGEDARRLGEDGGKQPGPALGRLHDEHSRSVRRNPADPSTPRTARNRPRADSSVDVPSGSGPASAFAAATAAQRSALLRSPVNPATRAAVSATAASVSTHLVVETLSQARATSPRPARM